MRRILCACPLLVLIGCHSGTAWQQAEMELCDWLVDQSGDCGVEEDCVAVVCESGCGSGETPVMLQSSALDRARDECQSTHWTTREWSETVCEDEDSVAVVCLISYYH